MVPPRHFHLVCNRRPVNEEAERVARNLLLLWMLWHNHQGMSPVPVGTSTYLPFRCSAGSKFNGRKVVWIQIHLRYF